MSAKTMKIKLSQGIAGQRTRVNEKTKEVEVIGHFAHNPGDIIDWDEAEARKFIERGIATVPKPAELAAA